MPEVAVAEDDDAGLDEDDVGLAWERGVVEAVAEASLPECAPEEHLGLGVAGPVLFLDLRSERRGRSELAVAGYLHSDLSFSPPDVGFCRCHPFCTPYGSSLSVVEIASWEFEATVRIVTAYLRREVF